MPDPELILDYASPRPRGRLRLPVESHIELTSDQDSTTITETLKGRANAIAAIIFAVFVLIVLIGAIVSQVLLWYDQNNVGLGLPIFLSILWMIEATLGAIVLDQTYRQTVLRVRDGEMTLTFSGLFSPTCRHRWPIEEVGELRVESTQSGIGMPPLAELQIRPARDVSVHLFTDHREWEVQQIATLISRALAGEHGVQAPAAAAPTTPDEATFNRLVQTHRALRESERAKRLDD